MDILLLLVAAGVGIGVGYAVFSNRGKGEHERAQVKAEKALAEAEAQAKQLTLKAQEDVLRAKESAKKEETELRKRLEASEARVTAREETLDQKEKQIDEKREQLDTDREQTRKLKEEIEEIKERQVNNLEKVSKLTQAKAKDVLLKMVEKDFSADLARKAKEIEDKATEEAEQRAKKIIAGAIQRYAADQSAELTVTTVKIPNDDVKGRIIGKEGRNIQAFEKATGVDIIVDDTPDTVVISGYNPVRRQVARIAMEKLVADGRINPSRIEEVVGKAEKEVNQVTKKAGEDALYELKLSG
ncbi:MAG: Rnase Y domain-containing protein, partial [Patescibacteria group bacterium]|nr:Rnase Y domain-containing protein [Patescibacteria group bacterium]